MRFILDSEVQRGHILEPAVPYLKLLDDVLPVVQPPKMYRYCEWMQLECEYRPEMFGQFTVLYLFHSMLRFLIASLKSSWILCKAAERRNGWN